MSGGSSAPDPYATAAAQTQSNEQTANYNAALNRVSQYTPYGNSVYSQTGTDTTGAPTWQNTITLTPEAQKQLDNQLAQNDQLSNIGFGLANQAQSSLANPVTQGGSLTYGASGTGNIQTGIANSGNIQSGLDTSGVPALPNSNDFATQVQQAQDAAYKGATQYLDPQWAKQQNDLNVQLANQGVQQGSKAYDQAQNLQGLQKQQAYNAAQDSAVAAGNALQNQLFTQGVNANQAGMSNAALSGNFANNSQNQAYTQNANNATFNNTAQQQGYTQNANNAALNNSAIGQQLQQSAYLNTLPLNELNALRSGTTIQNPTFSTAPQSTAANTDVSGDIYKSYQLDSANQNNFLNGLFGLGSSALTKYSDRRLKRDIERVGVSPIMHLPLYVFRYVWDEILHVGVMAQDVLGVRPEAVITMPNGYMAVDYGMLA